MKTVKITLSFIVIAAIAMFIIRGCISEPNIEEIQPPSGNKITDEHEQKIKSLEKMTVSTFCYSLHKEIKEGIEIDFIDNNLSKIPSENEQWKNILTRKLYAAYTAKFINQAFYVFEVSDWEVKQINFISKEYQALQIEGNKTGLLVKNSVTDQKLNEIKNILAKYNEINGLINSCQNFPIPGYELSDEFPINTIEYYIKRSKEYLESNLENIYVNKCSRLKANLREVPQILFDAHVKYLDKKINHWTGNYNEGDGPKEWNDYKQDIYMPLSTEIDKLLDNNIYNVANFDTECQKLRKKLDQEGVDAFDFYNK